MKNNFHLSIENAGQLEFLRNTRVTGFSSLEISGDLLEQNKESFPKNFRICAIRDLISPVLARLITFENISMQIKFGQLLRRQIALASELGATSGTIDFDLPEIIGTPEKEKQLHLLLKGLFGIAAGYKFKLLIQLRIPGSTDFDMQQLLRFKQGLLYPDFGYIFDFHPHEPGAFDFEEKVAKLPFDTGFWRLSFEPDKAPDGKIQRHDRSQHVAARRSFHLPRQSRIGRRAAGKNIRDHQPRRPYRKRLKEYLWINAICSDTHSIYPPSRF